jgi:hypothetical protein
MILQSHRRGGLNVRFDREGAGEREEPSIDGGEAVSSGFFVSPSKGTALIGDDA